MLSLIRILNMNRHWFTYTRSLTNKELHVILDLIMKTIVIHTCIMYCNFFFFISITQNIPFLASYMYIYKCIKYSICLPHIVNCLKSLHMDRSRIVSIPLTTVYPIQTGLLRVCFDWGGGVNVTPLPQDNSHKRSYQCTILHMYMYRVPHFVQKIANLL